MICQLDAGRLSIKPQTCGASDDSSRLILTERANFKLPGSFEVTGGAAASNGSVLLFDDHSDHLLLVSPAGLHSVRLPRASGVVASAFISGDSIAEVVDARRRSIFRLNLSREKVLGERFFSTNLAAVESATYLAGKWFIGGRTLRSTFQLVDVAADGKTHDVSSRLWGGSLQLPTAYVGADSGDVIVTSLRWPFSSVYISPVGDAYRMTAPADCLSPHDRLITHDWISLPLLRVRPGYVQVLANLNSDDRVMILYDAHGNTIRATHLTIPMGFFAASPTQHLLFALIALGDERLVIYNWRWGQPSTTEGNQ